MEEEAIWILAYCAAHMLDREDRREFAEQAVADYLYRFGADRDEEDE